MTRLSAALLVLLCAPPLLATNPSGALSEITGPDRVEPGEQVAGKVLFASVEREHHVLVRWTDAQGRHCAQLKTTIAPPQTALDYAFTVARPVGPDHRIEVLVDDKPQPVSRAFVVRFPYEPWVDYCATVWAHYTAGQADLVRQVGFNGTIAAADRNATGAGLAVYVDNIAYEVFAYYHKRPQEHRAMKELWLRQPNDPTLAHRRPSLTDEGTWDKVRDRLVPAVEKWRDYRPLFYNIADEIGIADQSATSDLDWEYSNRTAWMNWLKARYGTLDALNRQWGTTHATWGDVRAFFPTTNHLYDQLWRDDLLPGAFGTIGGFNEHFGTRYAGFVEAVKGYRNVRTDDAGLTAAGLEQTHRTIDALNAQLGTPFDSFAAAAAYIAKLEQWARQQTAADTRGWNLSWWCDWREYMDEYLAAGLGRARDLARQADPNGRYGITGIHHPGAFNGHNYVKLMKHVDLIMPYDIGQPFELMRGLDPGFQMMHPTWETGDRLKRNLWYYFLMGCHGSLVWDNDEPAHRMIDSASGKLTARGEAAAPVYREITAGLDRLLIEGKREHAGIALYHSPASIRVNWVHQFVGLGRHYILRPSSAEYAQDETTVLRTSWLKLIEDNHLQPIFLSPEQLLDGRLKRENVKVLVLPEVWALGDDEAAAIRRFAESGGTVIADQYTALYDAHGKRRDRGALDDLFGIDQSKVPGDVRTGRGPATTQQPSLPVRGAGWHVNRLDELNTRGPGPRGVAIGDQAAKALFGNADVDVAWVTRSVGRGRAVFLNLDLSHYARVRMTQPEKAEKILTAVRAVIPDDIQPPARIRRDRPGQPRQPGSEVARWDLGPHRKVLAVWRNYQVRQEGVGGGDFADNAVFEKPEDILIALDKTYHVTNERTGRPLGQTDRVPLTLSPWEPVLLTLQDVPVESFTVDAPKSAKPGDTLVLHIAGPRNLVDALQVFHVQAVDPHGRAPWYYTKDLSTRAGRVTYAIPLALNEPQGTWTLRLRDVATGLTQEVKVDIRD